MRAFLLAVLMIFAGAGCGVTDSLKSPAADADKSTATTRRTSEPARTKLRYRYREGQTFTHRVQVKLTLVSKQRGKEPLDMGTARMKASTMVTSSGRTTGSLKTQYREASGNPEVLLGMVGPNGKVPPEKLSTMGSTVTADGLGRVHDVKWASPEKEALAVQVNEDATYLGPVLPAKPVKPGDTWISRQTIDGAATVTTSDAKYTFERWVRQGGRRFARIKSISTLNRKDTQRGIENKIRANYTYLFDPSRGISVKTTGTSTIAMPGTGVHAMYQYVINTAK